MTVRPEEAVPSFAHLTERFIPLLDVEQLDEFSLETIHAHNEGDFQLRPVEDTPVIGVDIGGDSLAAEIVSIHAGKLVRRKELKNLKGIKDGNGYLAALEEVALIAEKEELPVGISYAGQIKGSTPIAGPNIEVFLAELRDKHGGDFRSIFPSLAASENDAVAGLQASALEIAGRGTLGNVIYIINGSGLNASALVNGAIWIMESGHVRVVDALNRFGQQEACGQFGNSFVCLERVAANKAGIEAIWKKKTHTDLDGRGIERKFLDEDNPLAGDLYDNSALIVAHMIQGVAQVFDLGLGGSSTALVGHGGAFKFPYYGERAAQILGTHLGTPATPPNLLMTKDFSPNACLDGAAVAALNKLAA